MKFRRPDGIAVLHLLDSDGVFNFDPSKMMARKIRDQVLRQKRFGDIKIFIYGIGPYKHDDEEFLLIFNQILLKQKTVAIYSLIDQKQNNIHECFAGDFLYSFNGKYFSFRETLIKEKLSYPSRIEENLNQSIFRLRALFLGVNNRSRTLIPAHSSKTLTSDKTILAHTSATRPTVVSNKNAISSITGRSQLAATFSTL